MNDPNLYPDGDYTFEDDGGVFFDDRNKAHWPALLRVRIPQAHAWRIVNSLLNQLQYPENRHDPAFLSLDMSGKIEREEGDA